MAVEPSEVIQLTIVPSTHRQRGDGRRGSRARSFATDEGISGLRSRRLSSRLSLGLHQIVDFDLMINNANALAHAPCNVFLLPGVPPITSQWVTLSVNLSG